MYWLFYSALEQTFANRRLHRSPPSNQAICRDSELLSAIVFALSVAFILFMYDAGATLSFADLNPDRLWYWAVSFVAVLILQDMYFYSSHRAFHHPQIFKRLHQGRHKSGDPTPWTSFAFDLPDAIVQAIFLVGVVFIIPLHFITLVAVLMTMTSASVITSSWVRAASLLVFLPLARKMVDRFNASLDSSSQVQSALWTVFHVLGQIAQHSISEL